MFLNPKSILENVKIAHGARVADFGSGIGHFAFIAAERLAGGGVVYALDAHRPVLDTLRHEAARRSLDIHAIESDLNMHIPLKDNLITLGIAANILHQLSDRKRFVEELARVVEPKGEVLVVDWVSSFKNMGPAEGKTILPGEAVELFTSAGFTPGAMLPAGTHHFAFIAKNA
jgi:ubiquinone/menaquinone biosynthesis C-methylase UbiE